MPLLLPLATALTMEEQSSYNSPISFNEISTAIKSLKNSAPGFDLIHNQMLKNLPIGHIKFLLGIFNNSLQYGIIPESWKKSIVIPILKPDKDPTNLDSYRPICLLPCIPKLMEKILSRRLTYFFEKNQAYSKNQGGFRKNMSTMEQIGRLENHIRETLISKEICVVVFIDLSKAYDCVWHTGLLYKLQERGIKGKILAWIKEYLENRTFSTYYEGIFSDELSMSSGVPQGGILSPTLFNIMVNDIPQTEGVYNMEYADDITILCKSTSVNEIIFKLERQLEKLFKWGKDWGFKINLQKTHAMMFTRRNIPAPVIKMNHSPLKFVNSKKYLGIVFDSPKLSWRNHIEYLSSSSISRINIMRAITRFQWGADRNTLLTFYKSVIRGKLDYGAMYYGVASHSNLKKLDKIQNSCIRIAIGAKKSSPVMSLEVESNIMPLNRYRNYLTLKYYMKVIEFPSWHPFQLETSDNFVKLIDHNWSSSIDSPPFHMRAIKLLESINMEFITGEYHLYLSPFIPWIDYSGMINLEFYHGPVLGLSNNIASRIFHQLLSSKYHNFIQIYTDGSCINEPFESSACSVVVFDPFCRKTISYKLNENVKIMGCELYAIFKALEYIKNLSMTNTKKKFVIFSDSLSGLQAITNPNPQTYKAMIFQIQNLLLEVKDGHEVRLQFIPGHKGIAGNEEADAAAKRGHSKINMESYMGREEKVRMMKGIIMQRWENQWQSLTESLQKGLHLKLIKNKIKFWPWTSHKNRLTETLFARLRIGHVNVAKFTFMIGKSPTDKCQCGQVETVHHLLLECQLYNRKRHELDRKLRNYNIDMTIQNLLGGGNFDETKQYYIINSVISFLSGIKRLKRL